MPANEALIARRDEIVEKIRKELQRRVRDSEITQRELGETNGFQTGYLSQVLNGRITLTVRHVIGVLLALGQEPSRFFDELWEPKYPTGAAYDEIRERLARYDAALDELERRGLVSGPRRDAGES